MHLQMPRDTTGPCPELRRWQYFDLPIPGTRKLSRLDENLAAAVLELDASDLHRLDAATADFEIQGERDTGHERYL